MTNPVSRVTDERLADFVSPGGHTRGPTMQECIDMARELQSLRALSPNSEGEAVAWRWKWGKTGQWYYGSQQPNTEDPRSPYFGKLCTVESLYTRPQPQQVEVSDDMVFRARQAGRVVLRLPTDIEPSAADLAPIRAALAAALRSDQK